MASPPALSSPPSQQPPAGEAEKTSLLLRQITEEGGFAFASSIEKAAASSDLRAAEAAREMAWEQLHSGPWHEVGRAWRDAYAMACLYVARIREVSGEWRDAMRALDLGIIMGGGLFHDELDDAVKRIGVRTSEEGSSRAAWARDKWEEGLQMNKDPVEILKVLPKHSLSRKAVEKRSSMSLEAFISGYFLHDSPVLITGGIDHWPACTKWRDISYLQRVAGERTIPVEMLALPGSWKCQMVFS